MKYLVSIFTVFSVMVLFAQEKTEKLSLVDLATKQLSKKEFPKDVQFAIGVVKKKSQFTFGFEKKEKWTSVDNKSSIFEIGSISKVFTSMLLTKAISEGVVNLTDTIQNDLHIDWKVKKPITYLMLANHTSGLPRIPSNLIKHALLNKKNPYAKYEEADLIKYLEKKMTVQSVPGEKYAYSNLGAGLLGYLVCKKFDLTYEEAIQKYILVPASMNHTSTRRETIEGEMVTGLNKKGKPTNNWDFDVFAGAGAIKSRVSDMLHFINMQVSDTSESVQLMQTNTHVGELYSLGLGWHIIPSTGWFWHNGGTGGFKSSVAIDTKAKNGVVILTNISSGHKNARFVDELVFLLLNELNKN